MSLLGRAARSSHPLVRTEQLHARRSGQPAEDLERRLFTVRFGGGGSEHGVEETPFASVANPALGGSPELEVWLSERPVRRGRQGDVAWAEDGVVLFGCREQPPGEPLAAAAQAQFTALLEATEARGYPHLLRVWNFVPGINELEGGIERYRLFNIGRATAFDERYGAQAAEGRFSASSAVGTRGTRLVTWFAAARSAGRQLGNPRQVHSFHYPVDYGPRAPSFSRATIAPPELGQVLFLSGTASIAGHESRHAGRLALQLEETLHNIDALLAAGGDEQNRLPGLSEFDLVRVYLRHADDLEAIREPLRRRLGERPQLVFAEADICRAELLVEIEGVARTAPRSPSDAITER